MAIQRQKVGVENDEIMGRNTAQHVFFFVRFCALESDRCRRRFGHMLSWRSNTVMLNPNSSFWNIFTISVEKSVSH